MGSVFSRRYAYLSYTPFFQLPVRIVVCPALPGAVCRAGGREGASLEQKTRLWGSALKGPTGKMSHAHDLYRRIPYLERLSTKDNWSCSDHVGGWVGCLTIVKIFVGIDLMPLLEGPAELH